MKAFLPNSFVIKPSDDLVRIGKNNDGGYIISNTDINNTEILISLGISHDWSFEENFDKLKKVTIYAYDASINKKIFYKKILENFINLRHPKKIFTLLLYLIKFTKFFSKNNVNHIEKYVGLNTNDIDYCTFDDVLNKIKSNNIFLKIDIEGSEYRFLDSIIKNQNRLSGLAIEFHDCDIHIKKIEDFIKNFSLRLIHVHANNYAPIRLNDKLPLALELTFSKYSNTSKKIHLPNNLDMPNNKNKEEIELIIQDS